MDSHYAKDSIVSCYESYENLGANGVIDDLMAEIKALPNYKGGISVFDNAKVILGNVLSTVKVKINAMSRPIKTVIVGYFLLVVVLVATYYIAWLYQWHNGQIVMSDLLAVIKEMIGPAMIGFMTFIAGCLLI